MLKDPAFNRRAIYTALHAYFDSASLLKVIAAWDQFCLRGQPSVQRFLAELCQSEALKAKRADMLRSILQAMNLPAAELMPEPPASTLVSASATTNATTAANNLPGCDIAFNTLFKHLLARTDPNLHSALHQRLLVQARRLPLPESLQQELQFCLSSHSELNVTVSDSASLRQVLNAMYIVLCEACGPVEADQLLAQAVQATQLLHPELNSALNLLL